MSQSRLTRREAVTHPSAQQWIQILIFAHFFLHCLVAKSCPALCHPLNCSPPGSSVHEIIETRILEWVAISFFRGSSRSRDQTRISCIGRWILYH